MGTPCTPSRDFPALFAGSSYFLRNLIVAVDCLVALFTCKVVIGWSSYTGFFDCHLKTNLLSISNIQLFTKKVPRPVVSYAVVLCVVMQRSSPQERKERCVTTQRTAA